MSHTHKPKRARAFAYNVGTVGSKAQRCRFACGVSRRRAARAAARVAWLTGKLESCRPAAPRSRYSRCTLDAGRCGCGVIRSFDFTHTNVNK